MDDVNETTQTYTLEEWLKAGWDGHYDDLDEAE